MTIRPVLVATTIFFCGALEPGAVYAADVTLTPASTSIQAQIDSAPEGTTFRFNPGTYRNFSVRPKKGDVFQGAAGVFLNGSTILAFRQAKTGLWLADAGPLPPETISTGAPCDASLKNADGSRYTIGCTHARSLYRNDAPLWRVATLQEVGPGKWYFEDSAKQVYVGDDPAGATIELGIAPDAFHGNAQNVTIASLTIEKYAGSQQHGAIDCEQGSGWTISANTVRLNHARGIGFGNCDAIKIEDNKVSTNGNLGIGGCCAKNTLIEGNEIDNNNYARFDTSWEAGGVKTARTIALTARKNNIHDNIGLGLWSDISAIYTIYDGNTVTNNSTGGIFYEISHGAWIIHNTANGNGMDLKKAPGGGWLYYGQITLSTSDHVVVEDNTVTVGEYGNGITIVDQQRGSDDLGLLVSRDNLVVGNKITYQTARGYSGAASDRDKVFQNNNVFFDNTSLGANPASHGGANDAPWQTQAPAK